VAVELAQILKSKYPGLIIAGTHCPPFRPLSEAEDEAVVNEVRAAKPDIVWVGLGCPKQERWMADHAARLPGTTLIGVGAAFDFHNGRVKRAPLWMQKSGLEWLHRLTSEPKRLWRRYLVIAPRFAVLASGQVLRQTLRCGA
jgi:N-acetylglucosaminyldiphosphoundecaprenol N-acetyl-beta-D-mannosaminyltransferase